MSRKPLAYIAVAVVLSFVARLGIFLSTELFHFSDFAVYLDALDNIAAGKSQYLQENNYLFLLSYVGYLIREVTGSPDWFFVFNCAAGAAASFVIALLVLKLSGSPLAAFLTVILHSLYTEFMVFSSVFYTPVIMMLIVAVIIWLLYRFLESSSPAALLMQAALILVLFLITFFLKPELQYLPYGLLATSLLLFRKFKGPALRTTILSFLLIAGYITLRASDLITAPPGNLISNSFVFFGHTDYGGDGGEGAFIYDENRLRYEQRFNEYLKERAIDDPGINEINAFQKSEMISFITGSPLKWMKLQVSKFFRTFGVMPESVSFKVLYTGLLKEHKWLTALLIVMPVVTAVSLFILLFSRRALTNNEKQAKNAENPSARFFGYVILMLFFYYMVASVFYGHYQERYRMPIMVLFIIPAIAIFIAKFDLRIFLDRRSLYIKGIVLLLFLLSWGVQTHSLIEGSDRILNEMNRLEDFNERETT
ncbi:MAG: hypothetical protein IH591_12915 [Bacteroidales bacterium]|nr:hypothetical protein [Bacteroidales bacterium]